MGLIADNAQGYAKIFNELNKPKQMNKIAREQADLYQDFFNFLSQEHNLTCTIEEMDEIIHEAQTFVKKFDIANVVNRQGTVKTIDFERTIDLLDAEIDSLKDAYHQETIADRKTQYSSMILESLHAKKKLKQ